MTRVVRIPDAVVEDIEEWLRMNGLYKPGMSIAASIKKFVNAILYEQTHAAADRYRLGSRTIDAHNPVLRGMLASKMGRLDFRGSDELPDELDKKFEEISKEMAKRAELGLSLEGGDTLVDRESVEQPTLVSDTPPWEDMSRIPFEDLEKLIPSHPMMKWAAADPVRTAAMEVTTAMFPKKQWKTENFYKFLGKLTERFEQWVADTAEKGDSDEGTQDR